MGSDGKESTCHVGDLGSVSGLGRSPGRGYGNPLQDSCLENLHGQRCLVGYIPWGHTVQRVRYNWATKQYTVHIKIFAYYPNTLLKKVGFNTKKLKIIWQNIRIKSILLEINLFSSKKINHYLVQVFSVFLGTLEAVPHFCYQTHIL